MANKSRDRNFMDKPEEGWLHDDFALAGEGFFYSFKVKYIGNIPLNTSMRSLVLADQTSLTRMLIRYVAEEADPTLPKSLYNMNRAQEPFFESNVVVASLPITLGISVEGILLAPAGVDATETHGDFGIIDFHHTQFISVAAGGEHSFYDYVMYVAKDDKGRRAAYVFDCGEEGDDVLATIGQSFLLAQNQTAARESMSNDEFLGLVDYDNSYFESAEFRRTPSMCHYHEVDSQPAKKKQPYDEPKQDGLPQQYFDPSSKPKGEYFDPSSKPAEEQQYFDVSPPLKTNPEIHDSYLTVKINPVNKAAYFDISTAQNATDEEACYMSLQPNEDEDAYMKILASSKKAGQMPALPEMIYSNPNKPAVVAMLNKFDQAKLKLKGDPESNRNSAWIHVPTDRRSKKVEIEELRQAFK